MKKNIFRLQSSKEIEKMEQQEEKIWREIEQYRNRAKELMENGDNLEDKVNINDRMETLIKLEEHLLWSWKRLDIDLKKGDPSLLITQEQRALQALNFVVNEHTVSVSHT